MVAVFIRYIFLTALVVGCAKSPAMSKYEESGEDTETSEDETADVKPDPVPPDPVVTDISDPVSEFKAKLQGAWAQKCQPFPDTYPYGEIEEWNFVKSQTTRSDTYFVDEACQTKSETYAYLYSFTIHESQGPGQDVFPADLVLVRVELTVHVQPFVDLYNSDVAWGYSDWALGVPKDITKVIYSGAPDPDLFLGDIWYTIFAVRQGFFGRGDSATGDGDTPITRPTALDPAAYLRVVQP